MQALEHLIKHHYEEIRRRVSSQVRDKTAVDDLVQDTFARYVQRCQSGLKVEDPVGFLKGTATVVVKEYFRKEGQRKSFLQRMAQDASPQRTPPSENSEPSISFQDLIGDLSPEDQELMQARHRDGLKWQAISERLQTPLQTLYSRYTRALERLHTLMKQRGGPYD